MGDSDDDGDFKRRDKFRSERRGYDGGGGSPPPRREYRDARPGPPGGGYQRNSYGGGGGGGGGGQDRGYRRGRDQRDYSPPRNRRNDMSPPNKRMRGNDWEDRGGYDRGNYDRYNDYDRGQPRSYGNRGGGATSGGGGRSTTNEDADGVQPVMMSFKAFLGTQDDSISDEEAIKKYAEYKLEFKRQQLNEFFVTHKDEEWFKLKYHPEDALKRKDECKAALEKRIDVFTRFLEEKRFNDIAIDGDQSDPMVKLLDSVVIFLEGGTDFDLEILDQELSEKAEEKMKMEEINKDNKELGEKSIGGEEVKKAEEEDNNADGTKNGADDANNDNDVKKEKNDNERKRKSYDEDSSSSDENEEEAPPPGLELKKDIPKEEEEENKDQETGKENGTKEAAGDGEDEKATKKDAEDEKDEKMEEEIESSEENNKVEDQQPKPRALHKTTSIFLRNLAPTITKQEVEAMCKRYPGFLRAAIADPQPERRWFRRGWITFERDVKIKEICYSLNNIRLRDFELGPIVNRDLSRRIRTVNGITVDRKVVRNNIKLAAKVITNLDKKWELWQKPQDTPQDADKAQASIDMGIISNNPILNNITDYLIEEASAEEEELLGKNNDLEDGEEGEEGNKIVRDEELVKVLDKLLFYLRIVHSVDFYSCSEYPHEDEMPNRCGIMHARGIPPTSNVSATDIDDYCANFEKKMGSFLQPRADLTDDEAGKLGMKNEDDEVEKFVQANTQELGKDKWLCPLSGKKFKGPDFVRKHIFNKHGEKVEEVKKEVQYYNNYLRDPKRPQLPENPKTGSRENRGGRGDVGSGRGPSDPPREATNYPIYDDYRDSRGYRERQYSHDRGGGYRSGGHRGGRPDQFNRGSRLHDRLGQGRSRMENPYVGRPIITYRDLDAPRDFDEF